ncbi:hypothetical protein OROMI_005076 [Orobanche minor]
MACLEKNRFGDLLYFRDLSEVDALIHNDKAKAILWYRRAKIAGKLQLFTGVSTFEAADKALEYGFLHEESKDLEISDGTYNPFFYKMKCNQCFSDQDFNLAQKHYLRAQNIFEEQPWKKAEAELQNKILFSSIEQEQVQKEKEKERKREREKRKNQRKWDKNEEKKEEVKEEVRRSSERRMRRMGS